MTPAELESSLRNESAERFTELILPLVAQENKQFARAALEMKRKAKEEIATIYKSRHSFSSADRDLQRASTLEARVQLAILAFCPWSEARKVPSYLFTWGGQSHFQNLIFAILKERRPEWLERWVNKEIDATGRGLVHWGLLRRLVREGLCPKPRSDNYILGMLGGVVHSDLKRSLKDNLLNDEALLADEIWRIFEISPVRGTIIQVSDATYSPGAGYPCRSWSQTLIELSAEDRLDRGRLLAASLGSLQRNTEARNTGWFQKFHELLEPTPIERQRLQASYLQLLSHPVPSVVGMAIDALAALEKAKLVDASAVLDAIGPAFHVRPKAQPLAAIKLLSRFAANKSLQPRLAELLLSGLSHPAAQVQEAIIKLLRKVRDGALDTLADGLAAQLEQLAPSVQEQARELLPEPVAVSNAIASKEDFSALSALTSRARHIPSPFREAAGIDAILLGIEKTGELSALSLNPMAVPRLRDEDRVQPVQRLDELIERLTVAIEGLDDPIEFELLVDGLSRLCDQRPDDFSARVAPLLVRIEKLLPNRGGIPLPVTTGGLRMALFKLILRWCDREVPLSQEERDSVFGFLDVRLSLVSLGIHNRKPAPLLACPTHRQGWIEPAEMLSRLQAYEQCGLEPSNHDFIQGILRLAPDGRSETLANAAALKGKFAAAFRYALGGPLEETALPAAVLVAAGRTRNPFAELTELSSIIDLEGPDVLCPARYSWQIRRSELNSPRQWVKLDLGVQPDILSPDRVRDLPTALMHPWRRKTNFAWDGQTGLNRWKATVWPDCLDSYFAQGAWLHGGGYSDASLLRQRATFLEPLFDPDVPFTEMAQLLLAICLSEQLPEVTGLAVDALVELIRDGRCTGHELGGVFGKMLPHDFIKLNRLGKHLETVARMSLLHAHVCAQIVQTACGPLAEVPRDGHYLLAPLLEWLSSLQQSVSGNFRSVLENARSGKTAMLAKKLLLLESTPHKRIAISVEALQGRLHRAERWSSDVRAG